MERRLLDANPYWTIHLVCAGPELQVGMIRIGERKAPPVNDLVKIHVHLHGRESYAFTEERICYHKR